MTKLIIPVILANLLLPACPQESPAIIAEWQKQAEQGDPAAQRILGRMYYRGNEVPLDFSKAFKWLRLSAEQGDVEGQLHLGGMYYNGNGVSQDRAETVRWWRAAAEQRYDKAQRGLGLLYFNGQGVPQDYIQAHKWLDLATVGLIGENREVYIKDRDRVAKKMTIREIVEAQRLANEWVPQTWEAIRQTDPKYRDESE